jgi:hypothetical protein
MGLGSVRSLICRCGRFLISSGEMGWDGNGQGDLE